MRIRIRGLSPALFSLLLVMGPESSVNVVKGATGLDSYLYQAVPAKSNRLITAQAAGPVRLGMTVAEARRSLPGFTLSRTSDGEGLALIAVKGAKQTVMTLFAGETNPKARINERARIEFIEVWDESYRTAAGVHPKMLLREVEQKHGELQEIKMSEIEAREYATFAHQPNGIQLRVMAEDGIAGVYGTGESTTARYSPTAYVFSISINSSAKDVAKFSSAYTDMKKDCKSPAGQAPEGQHSSTYCTGPGGYRIHLFDSAMSLHIQAQTADKGVSIPLATQSLNYEKQGHKIEWRLVEGKPFAVILRVFKYSGAGEYPLQEKPIGEALLVKGLNGFEHIDYEVDTKTTPDANERARELADAGFAKKPGQLRRNAGESLQDFAARVVPTEMQLAHPAIEGAFGPSARSIVILFNEKSAANSYEAWVLVPEGDGYQKHILPKPEFTWSIEEPKAIFFANVDRDRERELLILAECYTGIGPTGAQPFNRTRVYDWTGGGFRQLEALSDKIGTAKTARAARRKLL